MACPAATFKTFGRIEAKFSLATIMSFIFTFIYFDTTVRVFKIFSIGFTGESSNLVSIITRKVFL